MTDDANVTEREELPEERGFDYARTVALSDGVFAIALTLLVLNISFPALAPGHHGDIGRQLLDRRGEIGSYALGFVAFLPYPTRVLGVYGSEPAGVALYASTNVIIASISASCGSMRRGLISCHRWGRQSLLGVNTGRSPRQSS